VGSAERWLRRLINPWSTRAAAWWCESGLRRRLLRQRARRVHGRQQRRPLVGPPMVDNTAASKVSDGVTEESAGGRGPWGDIHHGAATSTDRAALLAGAGRHLLRRRPAGSHGARAGSRTAGRAPWYGQRVTSEPGWAFSPGGWTPPPGVLPAWSWLPPDGARPRLDVMPWWVRVWYALPLLDRSAHAWMWANGGWEVCPPPGGSPVEHTGGREPRDPLLPGRQSGAALAIPQTDQQPH